MTDLLDDRLHRLNEELSRLLGRSYNTCFTKKTSPEQLTKFGLTIEEAKNWIDQEPNFIPSDESYHGKKSDDKLPEP